MHCWINAHTHTMLNNLRKDHAEGSTCFQGNTAGLKNMKTANQKGIRYVFLHHAVYLYTI